MVSLNIICGVSRDCACHGWRNGGYAMNAERSGLVEYLPRTARRTNEDPVRPVESLKHRTCGPADLGASPPRYMRSLDHCGTLFVFFGICLLITTSQRSPDQASSPYTTSCTCAIHSWMDVMRTDTDRFFCASNMSSRRFGSAEMSSVSRLLSFMLYARVPLSVLVEEVNACVGLSTAVSHASISPR